MYRLADTIVSVYALLVRVWAMVKVAELRGAHRKFDIFHILSRFKFIFSQNA